MSRQTNATRRRRRHLGASSRALRTGPADAHRSAGPARFETGRPSERWSSTRSPRRTDSCGILMTTATTTLTLTAGMNCHPCARNGPNLLVGAPCRTRTCDLLVRSQTLYPTELRARRPTEASRHRPGRGRETSIISHRPGCAITAHRTVSVGFAAAFVLLVS